jgi:hypothetical protein
MHPRTHELLEYLDEQRAALRAAFERIPASSRSLAPAAGGWSSAEIVEHLSIVNRGIAKMLAIKIVKATRSGLGPETSTEPVLPTIDVQGMSNRSTRITAPDSVQPTGLSADEAWAELEWSWVALEASIRECDGFALATITHPHPALGPLSLYGWIAFAGAHAARHTQQIRERLGV